MGCDTVQDEIQPRSQGLSGAGEKETLVGIATLL